MEFSPGFGRPTELGTLVGEGRGERSMKALQKTAHFFGSFTEVETRLREDD